MPFFYGSRVGREPGSAWPNALPEHFFTFEVKRLAAMRRLRVETVQEGPLGQDREPGPHRLEPRNS